MKSRAPHPSREDASRLVVFGDDWGRHPSSCQHLVRGLLPRYRVDWVNTVGMRSPRLTLGDLKRGFGKLREWCSRTRRPTLHGEVSLHTGAPAEQTIRAGPRIWSPPMLPRFHSRLERLLNERLLFRGLSPILAAGGDEGEASPLAVVTTVPVLGDLARRTRHLNWIYYCCDAYAAWPGADGAAIRSLEGGLIESASRIIVVSEALRDHVARAGRDSTLLTHGVDLDFWAPAGERALATKRARPVALFWGRVDARLDVESCLALADACDLVLLGAIEHLDPRLRKHASIALPGAVPLEALPARASAADVLVMPYRDAEVTRAMQPLKLKEYLATGLPILAAPLPAVREWSDALDLCDSPERFARLARERAGVPLPAGQRAARARLRHETWAVKTEIFEGLLRGLPGI